MLSKLRSYRPSHATVVAYLALFIALGGTSAYALSGSNTVFTDDIVDGEVRNPDLRAGAVTNGKLGDGAVTSGKVMDEHLVGKDVKDNTLAAAEIATGGVRTDELGNGQVQAEDLAPGVAPGASGARAWGVVDPLGAGGLVRSKNVSGVTPGSSPGTFCVDPGSGIDASTAAMVVGEVSPNNSTSDDNDNVSHVEWSYFNVFCPAGTMEVRTFGGFGASPTGTNTDIGGFNLSSGTEPFTFVIP